MDTQDMGIFFAEEEARLLAEARSEIAKEDAFFESMTDEARKAYFDALHIQRFGKVLTFDEADALQCLAAIAGLDNGVDADQEDFDEEE